MRILFLTHAFNSLTQRLHVELRSLGHQVSVEFDINDAVAQEAVERYQPDLVIAPFLKRAIPESIWRRHVCLVVHPGIRGDRGPSSLDWAILKGETRWAVTVLQANEEMDAGDIWASVEFEMRAASKGSLYRNEVTEAAVEAIRLSVDRFAAGDFRPEPLDASNPDIQGEWRPLAKQADRSIDWQRDSSESVLSRIRSGDGVPGVKDTLFGRECFLFDARPEPKLKGAPGELIARCGPAICRATVDGAVWIGHLKEKSGEHPFKLPATQLLADEIEHLPEIEADEASGYREIWYEEADGVGLLHFPFYNGAMSSEQCEALLQVYRQAKQRETKVILLMGGPDYWSNGMHLNRIEAASSAADESWRNINAIDDLAREIIETESHLTIAALQGNAGAGGVFLARAADEVWARRGVILNPHYKDMGNLYGSEYWTYLLPRYAGKENAERIVESRLPMGVDEAKSLSLIDQVIDGPSAGFVPQVRQLATAMIRTPAFTERLHYKNARRQADESLKPLARYREEELEQMKHNFYGFDPSYHVARYNFVYKVPKSRTPLTLANHRRTVPLRRVS
ncbi:MAG: hydrogenase maturation protein [Candidatus Thiodiazotropha sp. (ex Myrtea sp. 'scaly one' KF741663)]|nr:hydrogenase maturation protein [Candidatus Thiodiazotropha sp. (ex Myrtea sp. 'scaly one' KF741663)]